MTKLVLHLALAVLAVTARAESLELAPATQLELADEATAAKLLASPGPYFQRMSAFDRAVRMRLVEPPSPEAFAQNAAKAAGAFTDAERTNLQAAWAEAKPLLEALHLAFPKHIDLVKTNGREDIGQPYCRGPLIVIPEKFLAQPPNRLATMLLHELFHVFSTHHLELHDRLYALLGYLPSNDVTLPPGEDARRFTNPDAMLYNYYTVLQHEGHDLAVTPVMLARGKYDPTAPGGAFDQVTLLLVELTVRDGQATPVLDSEGRLVTHEAAQVPAFMQHIARNTGYIIHPEEALADNFVHTARKTQGLPDPELPGKLLEIMQSAKPR